ncbi:hypothetical protein EHV15_05015 [Paenibacillus oralis]|uniref:Uncharacterized protein n=1 Tax=Paenibacillus oralis TaxID=2490856 RepID=A0A3P3TX25_9BACL|nr:hypothetical protein [Paenibacillus oralis]RRJ62380.1 hypothetical protein EHV15_05015 [Paenibacillus oralis]
MNGKITTEELTMIRDYVLLPHMEQMVERSLTDVEHSTNILKSLYTMAGRYVLNSITSDMRKLRAELRQRNIKISNEEHSDFIVYYRYYCRGYQDRFGMTRDVMRSEISTRLGAYVAAVGGAIKKP